jgi:thiol-disulfide isomerase/thioredoxin
MKLLETQAQFEEFWFDTARTDAQQIIYFTAEWCKPCRNLDCDAITAAAAAASIPILKCDAVVNDYTAGYCGVTKFPTFLHIAPKRIISRIASNKTADVVEWIEKMAA